jgi:hypothetical protein
LQQPVGVNGFDSGIDRPDKSTTISRIFQTFLGTYEGMVLFKQQQQRLKTTKKHWLKNKKSQRML